MQPKNLIALLFSMLLSFSAWAGSDTILIPSYWANTEGSTSTLSSTDSAGKITGTYVNNAAGYNCQNITYLVTGWVYGTAITFDTKSKSASESYNSITSWAGCYYQGQITTFWNLDQNGSITSSQIVQGKDTFTPVTKVVNKKLIHTKKFIPYKNKRQDSCTARVWSYSRLLYTVYKVRCIKGAIPNELT